MEREINDGQNNPKDVIADEMREKVLNHAKDFKTSWVALGQTLHAIWQDKYFYGWGYDKFEYYTESELGLKKSLCLKLLKNYLFLEQEEPNYLSKEFKQENDALKVPNYDAIDVLRMARKKPELLKTDYQKIRKDIFDKGKNASLVRKDLTALIKERKVVDPDEEREQRNCASIKKLLSSLQSFKKDMETLKLIDHDVLETAKALMNKLETQVK